MADREVQGSPPLDARVKALVGSRVVARYRLESPDAATGASLTDAVGYLVAADAESLIVATRSGEVRVARDRLTALKQIPPRPARRRPAHLADSVEGLQRAMLSAWGAVEREALGDWQLRASGGFTQRGNSVVPIGSPGLALAAAVDHVERWYAARGLRPCFALAGPQGFEPAEDPLGAILLPRGYTTGGRTLVLTQRTATVAAADPGGPAVRITDRLTPDWLAAYRHSRATVPGATETVLSDGYHVRFGAIASGGDPSERPGPRDAADAEADDTTLVAVARLSIGSGWAGLGAVWTDPSYRGRGLAGHLTARLAAYARDEGTSLMSLQVEADNEPAVALYRRMGCVLHSTHAYLTAPQSIAP